MNMLELTKTELEKFKALAPSTNSYINQVMRAIPSPTIDPSMKAVISVAQLTNFAAQFRRNVLLWDETSVPINAISFVITGSGAGKDSAVKAASKCFSKGFDLIETERKRRVRDAAIQAARNADDEPATEYDIYKKYLKPIPPIDIMPTTGPGLIQHINDIGELNISSGFLYAGEFSDELAYNPDIMENIKILSETYDTGDKQAKYTKGAEHRSTAISGQPVSALFVGSPGHILYDESTKKKFHIAFMSKLARRSWFCYTPQKIPEPDFSSHTHPIDALLAYEESLKNESLQARAIMQDQIADITTYHLSRTTTPLTVHSDVFKLFKIYQRYNNELADTVFNQDSTSVLIRRHLQWKAIKLAGAFAIMDKSNEVSAQNYLDAIRFCELLSNHMQIFEHDLNKAPHERFSDYIQTQVQPNGKAICSIHDLKKNNYINNVSRQKLQELVTLCAGYDSTGIYSIVNEASAIQYEPIIKTSVIGISFKPIDCTALNNALATKNLDAARKAKHDIALTTAYGYEVADTVFADLVNLLSGDFAYSPFKFNNGVRGRDNILGGTKWIVLDVDTSPISASEAHFMLSDINHHIALSSDPTNEFKFRVLIELDSYVELSPIAWKHFTLAIAKDLAITPDPLAQSTIFYSYANRPIYSVTDASPLEARSYIMLAKELEASKPSVELISTAQQKALLADPLTTFGYAFNAPMGSGSRNIIRAIYHLQTLNGTLDQALQLYSDIQEYWELPFESHRDQKMREQIQRMF
jgi:hypothetical protein